MISNDKKEKLLNNIKDARDGDFDESVANDISLMDEVQDVQIDIEWMKAIGDIYGYGFSGSSQMDTWRWDVSAIASGRYPLDKLPDHVRDIAEALYYLKNAPKAKSA